MSGIELIARERERQIRDRGFTEKHDSSPGHLDGELARYACYYAMPGCVEIKDNGFSFTIDPGFFFPEFWSYELAKRKGKSRIEQLTVAGALIAAEIDRLLRLEVV